MTPKEFYKSSSVAEIDALCCEAKTSRANFRLIAMAGGAVSSRLAERLALASRGKMTELEILYPQRYESCSRGGRSNAA